MTPEQQTVLIIKGTIADMQEDHRKKVMDFYAKLKMMAEEEPLSLLAMALIGAELAAK